MFGVPLVDHLLLGQKSLLRFANLRVDVKLLNLLLSLHGGIAEEPECIRRILAYDALVIICYLTAAISEPSQWSRTEPGEKCESVWIYASAEITSMEFIPQYQVTTQNVETRVGELAAALAADEARGAAFRRNSARH